MIYPKAVFGFIIGPVRYEIYPSGDNIYDDASDVSFIINERSVKKNSKVYVLTHLQKRSPFGFLLTWPFGFHFWYHFHKQETTKDGTWKPNTEKGIYFRLPGYRWDLEFGMIRTNGYFGSHWD